ncbi:ornithine carbamoyltransferase [Natrinema pellirubrum DSM 15624]|uniref:Ornithine carbamoyltransferase n=1 Tax=Natrinema pellirubrum (strain DSM 15624 / CIP 106293 / JCM 10476 / NCIMB 786 / 157) TaxID=797303 RepID=L0JPJ9_NATP1|nr:ornithine carbamoyltransferase [Natrinema pellirubrum]AGB33445.1 ornithine carbamoyltransferase [Natrinema pellirubrum DSM 15624]ELY71134.1 ornithine carbamoyltransferase [Natrinema pellirubrum DSM 15624]
MTTATNETEPRHFLDVDDLSEAELLAVLDRADEYKRAVDAGDDHADLSGQTLGMLFQKASTRTRVSFETGMTQLGGHAIFLGEDDIQLGRGEPLKDTSRALSRYVDAVMARVFKHENVEVLAEYSSVPIVNGLTDDAHPCQTLADLQTIREHEDGFEDVSAAWIGDGNNVAQSFALGCALTDIDLTIATPEGYEVDGEVLERARELGGDPTVTTDPVEAATDADVIYTDVWISMGQEDERDVRMNDFEGFQVNTDLLENAPDASVMHCLPAHRGEEVTDDVIEGDRSIVFDQAENRLHAQKALLSWLLE